MRIRFWVGTIIFTLLSLSISAARHAPFSRGVNLAGWLQTSGPRQIQFSRFSKDDFANLKALGCDHIRLPINLHAMTGAGPDYTIDPLLYDFLDPIVDWAEELELHLILDNHSFDPAVDTDPDIGQILLPVWSQMADHFKTRSRFVYYEILNEPHGISDERWNAIQQEVITAIRQVDTTHTIIVGPAGWNSYHNLNKMPAYADSNLIYTFHFYDPFLFTHQGASWTSPSLVPLAAVPFPFDAARMPACPPELQGTWIEGGLNDYAQEGTIGRVEERLDIAATFQQERDVPLLCGEFGVYMPNSADFDRNFWHYIVRSYLEKKGIAWSLWSYDGGFGLFERDSGEMFEYDLNIALIQNLGLTPPAQKKFILHPDSNGLAIYGDYLEKYFFEASWSQQGEIDYYNQTQPANGKYCIHWTSPAQYNLIGFDLKPDRDFSYLKVNGFALEFWLRVSSAATSFDIRFVDTKTNDTEDHPWRMRRTIDQRVVSMDGNWHKVRLPLNSFSEHGSWDNGWYEPIGAFDWQAIDRLEIVAEQKDLNGVELWFDDIKIIDPAVTVEPEYQIISGFRLYPNYPNPFNTTTVIRYQLAVACDVDLSIYSLSGQRVATLASGKKSAGSYKVRWDATGLASGVYLYKIQTDQGYSKSGKLIFLK